MKLLAWDSEAWSQSSPKPKLKPSQTFGGAGHFELAGKLAEWGIQENGLSRAASRRRLSSVFLRSKPDIVSKNLYWTGAGTEYGRMVKSGLSCSLGRFSRSAKVRRSRGGSAWWLPALRKTAGRGCPSCGQKSADCWKFMFAADSAGKKCASNQGRHSLDGQKWSNLIKAWILDIFADAARHSELRKRTENVRKLRREKVGIKEALHFPQVAADTQFFFANSRKKEGQQQQQCRAWTKDHIHYHFFPGVSFFLKPFGGPFVKTGENKNVASS